ncbi:MAG: C25 family cysteine peptidase, partial [Candidatus Hydrothermae bacterium]|nr:C25 family cysteine peptidase [Candidatus Hydrothermae bacterium]
EGSLFLNCFGHGNPVTLTHEDLLPPSSYEALDARNHGALAVFASCKVGAFDRVEPVDVIGEVLLKRNVAVGVISSTAISFAFSNEIYVRTMVQALAAGDAVPMGWLAYVGRNNRYYVLLGDPAVRIQLPARSTLSTQVPDTLVAGQSFTYAGNGDTGGQEVWVAVRGMPRDTTYVGPTISISYTRPGPFWFRGRATVQPDGAFGGEGILPRSLDTLHPGEVRVVDVETGHTAYLDSLTFRLSGQIPLPGAGPELQVSVNHQPLSPQHLTPVPATAEVDVVVQDSQGLHPTEGLRFQVVETGRRLDLMPFFQYDPGTYTKGTAHVRTSFPAGDTVHLVVQALDNESNETVDTFLLRVLPAFSLTLERFLPYPNPWNGQGEQVFTFWMSRRARVTLRVFALNGKPMYERPWRWMEAGFHVIRWRGRDLDGRPLASGLYLAQLLAVDANGKQVSRTVKVLIRR